MNNKNNILPHMSLLQRTTPLPRLERTTPLPRLGRDALQGSSIFSKKKEIQDSYVEQKTQNNSLEEAKRKSKTEDEAKGKTEEDATERKTTHNNDHPIATNSQNSLGEVSCSCSSAQDINCIVCNPMHDPSCSVCNPYNHM